MPLDLRADLSRPVWRSRTRGGGERGGTYRKHRQEISLGNMGLKLRPMKGQRTDASGCDRRKFSPAGEAKFTYFACGVVKDYLDLHMFPVITVWNDTCNNDLIFNGQHGGSVVSTGASQQEGLGFESWLFQVPAVATDVAYHHRDDCVCVCVCVCMTTGLCKATSGDLRSTI